MKNVYSVKQINSYIKDMFDQDFMLRRIYVKGEISNCKYHSSGHIYFSLKDGGGILSCVMFAGDRGGLSFKMHEGDQVIAFGSISVYERNGTYQLYAKEIIRDGVGLLYEKFEALKKELEEMGMFAKQYKRPIPKYARRIGVVTAPTGAAIQDICNITFRRNPYVQLILYPALVQGDGAVCSIISGIQALSKMDVDVMIIGRGGGSIEDLWAFNERAVAEVIFDCEVPIISAVGHETDVTIADFVADLRAPTPSAAAELAVYKYHDIDERLTSYSLAFKRTLYQQMEKKRDHLKHYAKALSFWHPKRQILEQKNRSADLEDRLQKQINQKVVNARQRLLLYVQQMKGISPLEKLRQGYAYVEHEKGFHVKSVDDVKKNDELVIRLKDGVIKSKVLDKQADNKKADE